MLCTFIGGIGHFEPLVPVARADKISRRVEHLLHDVKARDRTRHVADEIRALPKVEETLPLLEKLDATPR